MLGCPVIPHLGFASWLTLRELLVDLCDGTGPSNNQSLTISKDVATVGLMEHPDNVMMDVNH